MLARFPVAVQIGLGFLLGVLLLGAVAAIGFNRLDAMRARSTEAAVLEQSSTLTRDVMAKMLAQEAGVRGYAATGDARFLRPLAGAETAMRSDLAFLDKIDQTNAVDSSRLEQIDLQTVAIESAITEVEKGFAAEKAAIARGDRASATALLARREAAFEKLSAADDALLAYTAAQAKAATQEFQNAATVLAATLVASAVAAAIVLSLAAFMIGARISRRLNRVTRSLIDVAERDVTALTGAFERLRSGDLATRFESHRAPIEISGRDEIALLGRGYNQVVAGLDTVSVGFNAMVETLHAMISGIAETSNDLARAGSKMSAATSDSTAAVAQISVAVSSVADDAHAQVERIAIANGEIEALSQGAQQIARGSADQAEASSQAVDEVEGLDEQISAFASIGGSLAEAARHAQTQTRSGEAAVSHTAEAMIELKEATGVAHAAMLALEERSAAVSEIVAVIDDMADQTNLLALNAAIEAARAGEHGRGFAVVAAEVRKLAENSRASTGKIETILQAIRGETLKAAKAIESASMRMDSGLALSQEASNALGVLDAAISQTASIADDVARRSEAMRVSSAALARNISSVSAIVVENAHSAQEAEARSRRVLDTIAPIAERASAQAEAASEVSAATGELSARIREIDSSSQTARSQSERLRNMVGAFGNSELGAARPLLRIAVVVAFLLIAIAPHGASATPEFARRTLLSCGACHSVATGLTDFGKAYKARGFDLGSEPVAAAIRGQAVYTGDPDPTGLPKLIVDEIDFFVSAKLDAHFNASAEVYAMDGGVPGSGREGWLEYHTSWTQRIPIAARAGLLVLPIPFDPERFRETNAHYAIYDQAVGDNPFNFIDPKNAIEIGFGKETRGLHVALLAVENIDQHSGLPPTGTDSMVALTQSYKNAIFSGYRYDGTRPLDGVVDRFWRQGYGANIFRGRASVGAALQTGYDTDPEGLGQGVASSGGFLQFRYQLGANAFAIAREDGVNDSDGNFARTFAIGAGSSIGHSFKLEVEDLISHGPQTHHTLSILVGFGASTRRQGSASY